MKVIIVCLLVVFNALQSLTLRYHTTISGKKKRTFFIIKETKKYYFISAVIREKGKNHYKMTKNFSVLSWKYTDQKEGTNVSAFRKENKIFLKGKVKKTKVNYVYKIDTKPWYQTMTMEFQHFSKLKKNKIKFWSINLIQMKANLFVAKKVARPTLVINEKKTKTVFITVTLDGILSLVWKGRYWFREHDGRFVRFRGASGFPGSPIAETIIVSEVQ